MVVGGMCKDDESIYLQDAWSMRRGSAVMSSVKALALQ